MAFLVIQVIPSCLMKMLIRENMRICNEVNHELNERIKELGYYHEIQFNAEWSRHHAVLKLYQTQENFVTDEMIDELLPLIISLQPPNLYKLNPDNYLIISLENSKITDHSVIQLSQIPFLGSLNVKNCDITDEAFQHVNPMNNLYSLNITGTKVSKEILKDVPTFAPNLKSLFVADWDISGKEKIELRKIMPELKINEDHLHTTIPPSKNNEINDNVDPL